VTLAFTVFALETVSALVMAETALKAISNPSNAKYVAVPTHFSCVDYWLIFYYSIICE
jgi:hypothetical protein